MALRSRQALGGMTTVGMWWDESDFHVVFRHCCRTGAGTDFCRAAMISDVPGQEDGAQPLR